MLALHPGCQLQVHDEVQRKIWRSDRRISRLLQPFLACIMDRAGVAGLSGALVASALTAGAKNAGPVDLLPLDDNTAKIALIDPQLAE